RYRRRPGRPGVAEPTGSLLLKTERIPGTTTVGDAVGAIDVLGAPYERLAATRAKRCTDRAIGRWILKRSAVSGVDDVTAHATDRLRRRSRGQRRQRGQGRDVQ